MTENKKIVLFSSVAVAFIAATIVWFYIQKSKLEKQRLQDEESQRQQEIAQQNAAIVKPIFNRNNELTNPLAQLTGKELIAKTTINMRSTPQVDNPTFWFPQDHNLLAKAKKGDVIGTVVSEAKGQETPQMRWLKVKIKNPIVINLTAGVGTISPDVIFSVFSDAKPGVYKYAWVRADVVTFKEYKK